MTPRALGFLVVATLALGGCGAKKLAKEGASLLEAGRTTHAARCYRQACEKRPSNGSFQLGYAIALLADGQADVAVAPARRAVEAEEEGAGLVLIEALVRTGQVDEARTLIDAALAAAPTDPALLELSAREFLVRGQPRQAVVAMKKVVEQEPTGERIAYMAWLFARAHEMPRALEAADRAFATEPTDLEALGDIAAVYLLAGREDNRKAAAREIQSFGTDTLDAWKERAGRAQQVGDNEGALRAMTATVALRPEKGELLGLLGQMYLSLGEHERAVQFLEAAMVSDDYRSSWERANSMGSGGAVHTMDFEDKDAAHFCLSLAEAHQAAGNKLLAGRSLQAALLIGGIDDPDPWLDAASNLLAAGDLSAAAVAGHHAYEANPQHPRTLLFLLDLYKTAGDAAKAIGYGRMAWQVLPGDPLVALTLGELYERRGDQRAARELYAYALQAHPDVGALRAAMKRVE